MVFGRVGNRACRGGVATSQQRDQLFSASLRLLDQGDFSALSKCENCMLKVPRPCVKERRVVE